MLRIVHSINQLKKWNIQDMPKNPEIIETRL